MDILSQLLTDNYKRIREENDWTSESRIIGEAGEDCVISMNCPICNEKSLTKYKVNEKSKDIKCTKCKCDFQVKTVKYSKGESATLKLLGAEYNTTCRSIRENNIHYLILMYSEIGDNYIINKIYFVNCNDINESCIIPRKPLSPKAKRAGWQGCILAFDKFKSIDI
jgi:type II restriction enzyme